MKRLILLISLLVLGNSNLFSDVLENVYAEYNCSLDVQSTLVSDNNEDGIYDTYTITWCDGTQKLYPIAAIGDIERWPPRGIPSRNITIANQSIGTFREEYYNPTNSNLISWFTKPAGVDTVYFYSYDNAQMSFTGVDENVELPELNLYPNPTSDFINISYSLSKSQSVKIYLYDEIGMQVKEIDNNLQGPGNYNLSIPVNELSSGNYILVIRFDLETVLTRKLSVVK